MKNRSPAIHYPSKRDGWIVFAVVLAAMAMLGVAGDIIFSSAERQMLYPLAGLCIGMAVLCLWIIYRTGYLLTDDALLIHCGPFRKRVLLQAIQRITPTRCPLSSPACSLDRLRVKYAGARWGVMISPREKKAFLEDLIKRCPQLTLSGEEAVLRETP